MNDETPVYDARPPDEEEKQLAAIFAELEKKQLDFLDEAGKRIVELSTALLGVFFAVVAFGEDFPPPYLQGNGLATWLTILILVFYVAAVIVAVHAIRPRPYKRYRHNLSAMRNELDRLIAAKARGVQQAGVLFVLGTLVLAVLVIALLLGI